jgi:hypothetical protein
MTTDDENDTSAASGESMLTGSEVEAAYNEAVDLMYRHNCLIEALPPALELDKAGSLLLRMPAYHDDERKSNSLRRLQAVQRLQHCFLPFPSHLELEQKFYRTICDGYMGRNPLKAETVRQLRSAFPDVDRERNGYENYIPTITTAPTGFAIIGGSGVGKTKTVESILSLIPQVIVHTAYNGTPFDQKQVVWLKLVCPYDASPSAICFEFFSELDRLLGTNYFERYCTKRPTADMLLIRMKTVAGQVRLGLLVVDEIQRIKIAFSGGKSKLMSFLEELTSKVQVPVVPVGTYKAFGLFKEGLAVARRVSGQGDVFMNNLADDEFWEYFLESIWRYQWTKVPTPLTPELAKVFYEQSQGILDIAVKLYMLTQWQAIGADDGHERITPKRVRDAAREGLHIVSEIVRAMRDNDLEALSKIDDVRPPTVDMDTFLRKQEARISMTGTLNTLRNQTLAAQAGPPEEKENPVLKVARQLVQTGCDPATAKKYATIAVGRFAADTDLIRAIAEAFRLAAEEATEKREVKVTPAKAKAPKKEKRVSLSGDLREIISKSPKGVTPYDALKAAGVIKPADEFFVEAGGKGE